MSLPDCGTADLYVLDLAQAVDPHLLSDAERERAQALRPLYHRERFVRRRIMLRTILAAYIAIEPPLIAFAYGPNGKPELLNSPLMFSMSASGDRAVVAVTQQAAVGVDVEQLRELDDVDELIRSYVPAHHAALLEQLPRSARSHAFLRWWTRYDPEAARIRAGLGSGSVG